MSLGKRYEILAFCPWSRSVAERVRRGAPTAAFSVTFTWYRGEVNAGGLSFSSVTEISSGSRPEE